MLAHGPWRWIAVAVAVLAVVALLAYARGRPGEDDRIPSREDAAAVAVAVVLGATGSAA